MHFRMRAFLFTDSLNMPVQASSAPTPQRIHWEENGEQHSAFWRSEAGMPPPKRVMIADDRTNADIAYRAACEGTALLWRGDFQNARQLLQALARRTDHKGRAGKKAKPAKTPTTPTEAFHLHRQAQSQRARTLAMLLIPFDEGYTIPLRRAPDVKLACNEAYGRYEEPFVASMRELLGLIGAHEWRRTGVEIPALGARIHPHYGVFSPVRGEYVQMVADAPLPKGADLAFDIGVGTGVLSAVLAKRGVGRVIATDQDQRALSCAPRTCSPKAARRWWCAIRRGCRRVRVRRSNTRSTIPIAACCAVSCPAWPSI